MPGEWHNVMEKKFPEDMREVKFYCSSISSNTSRRADICLNNNRTCEIQHSYISENEIVNRFNDWNKFGKEIIWLIDGNDGVELVALSNGNYLILFKQCWKYKSFIKTYDFILLEKNKLIFKIELNKIRNGMIELKESKTLQETIDYLKTKPEKIWEFWSDDNVVKSILGVYQQGAGNGKTYGIWKSITENIDKKTYIIVTKQHSAKTVIYQELKDQKKRFDNGEDVYHIENLTNNTEENTNKHYVIKYTHKLSKRECIVIIGTIDSFCFNLSHSNMNGSNFFKGIVDNIKNNGATKIKHGYMRYAGQSIQLNKECEIWIDEVQDLPENYLHAMLKLMYETSCYINIVGDKLQSLDFANNFLTSIIDEGLPNINIDIKKPINNNRRIKVSNMADKINKIINFGKYKLPIIEYDKNIIQKNNEEAIKIIESPIIYANDINDESINRFCDKIMTHYINEIETNNYNPNDFLIIFPIMKSNVIASELQTKIQEYWTQKYDYTYTQYVYLHKHTEGHVINTNDSINATRIMSIKSSKGDGRKVVFILGCTEYSLKIVSNNEIGLVYDSHLHVALTRAKNQIYFGLIKNNDEIHQRFGESGYVAYLPNISKNIKLDKINELINKTKLIELLNNNNININTINTVNIVNDDQLIQQAETVDWGYHCIKYQTFYYNVILNIINNSQTQKNQNSQLFVKLRIISKYEICTYNVTDFYKFLNKYEMKNFPKFPLCKLSDKSEYKKYYNKIKTTIKKVQENIKNEKIEELNVYESIILTYMIQLETNKKYADMSPMDMYNITDFFHTNSNKEHELLNNISNIQNIINKSCIKDYHNINWNILKQIELNSPNNYFKISKSQFPIIGNNKTDIIHIMLKTNISDLNFWDIMVEVLLERFLIYNPKLEKDKNKFKDKKINTYLFLLDKNSFIKIDWDWDKALNKDINIELKYILEQYYQTNHTDIYKYFSHIRNNKTDIWDEEPEKIIDDIIQRCTDMKHCPDYIIDTFKDINTKIDDNEYYNYVNKFETFNIKLNKKLQSHTKKYLCL